LLFSQLENSEDVIFSDEGSQDSMELAANQDGVEEELWQKAEQT